MFLQSGGAAIDLYPEINGVVQADPVNLEAVDMDYLNTPIDFTIISCKCLDGWLVGCFWFTAL